MLLGGYVHIETIFARAPLNDWTIRVHRHEHFVQCVRVTSNGGRLEMEGEKA